MSVNSECFHCIETGYLFLPLLSYGNNNYNVNVTKKIIIEEYFHDSLVPLFNVLTVQKKK